MLLGKSSVFCPAIGEFDKFHVTKSSVAFIGRNAVRRSNVIRGSFGSKRPDNVNAAVTTKEYCTSKGVGILDYFQGKNILITGATGLLGKVIVEKLLRSTSVDKIYVLVRAENQKSAVDRLDKELINLDLFKRLEEKHGKYYQAFVREKLIPVVGNICEPNLGMDSDSATTISKEVNVIIDSAAITTLNERYDILLDANVKGPQRLMMFAKACKNLELFVHISTAYVNGEKQGTILEQPLTIGEHARKESSRWSPCLSLQLDIANEINMAVKSCTGATNYDITNDMRRIGMERANVHGWYNTYHLTKAMAEMVLNESRGDIPLLIVRPTAIESCYMEPVPGWIQGNRMFDPFIISYGKGQLPGFLGNPDTIMDIIPLDIVGNSTIAATAKHGKKYSSTVSVYHMASSVVNPLRFSDFFEYLYEYFTSEPLVESQSLTRIDYYDNLARIKYFDNFDDFSKYTREELSRRSEISYLGKSKEMATQKLQKKSKAMVAYLETIFKLYEFIGFFGARFHAGNTQMLWSEMSNEEQMDFSIDIRNIDWKKYLQEIHIPGVRKHVLTPNRCEKL